MLSNPKVDALGRVPLFAGCSRKELEFLVTRTDEVDVQAGRRLITQGTPSDAFYLLLEGEYRWRSTVAIGRKCAPEASSARSACLTAGLRPPTVVAVTPARLLVMSHAQFREAIKGTDRLLSQVMGAMAERLRRDSLDRNPVQNISI